MKIINRFIPPSKDREMADIKDKKVNGGEGFSGLRTTTPSRISISNKGCDLGNSIDTLKDTALSFSSAVDVLVRLMVSV